MFQIQIPGFILGVTQAHEKCVMKIKERNKKERKNDGREKYMLMTGKTSYGCCRKKLEVTDVDEFRSTILHIIKVLFV